MTTGDRSGMVNTREAMQKKGEDVSPNIYSSKEG
jgi:hypothetical protein